MHLCAGWGIRALVIGDDESYDDIDLYPNIPIPQCPTERFNTAFGCMGNNANTDEHGVSTLLLM